MTSFKVVTDQSAEFWRGKKVLVRIDANVPLDESGRVANGFRLEQARPTIDYLRQSGARLILLAHLGSDESRSLAPVVDYWSAALGLKFAPTLEAAEQLSLNDGEVALLENLRFNPGEEQNDPAYAKQLASLGEVYVNESFSVSHRAHASIVGLPALLPAYAGISFAAEVAALSEAFAPEHPFVVIVSGAKFSTKVPLVKKFLPLADRIIIGGALANSFYQARGWEVGTSLVHEAELVKPFLDEPKLMIPFDVRACAGDVCRDVAADAVGADEKILDAGPASTAAIVELLKTARLVLWNGPLGNFEHGFIQATAEVAKGLANSGARSIIGGGDTVAALQQLDQLNNFSFVSTAGGAMLDFLGSGTLPGVEALNGRA